MINKWSLVTGSSRGLGLDIALEMAAGGFSVVITGRNPETLAAAMEKLSKSSPLEHCAVCIDLAAEDGPQKLYTVLKEKGIAPCVIVNCLGGGVPGDRRNVPTDILRASLRLNLEVGIEINNLFYEDIKTSAGVIIHIGSNASIHLDTPPGYAISKAALNAYVKNAARTFAKEGVCIFAVLAGILDYEGSYFNRLSHTNPERYQKALSETTFGRFTTSQETARFIVKILQAQTPMISGALIQFDGGKV